VPAHRERERAPERRATCGVDTGGTFTDLVLWERGTPRVHKLPSTPADPSRAVLAGLAELGAHPPRVVHGTTVALNALLTGRHARAALVTNRGFRDLIEIGRQDRPVLYALHPVKPPAIVPRELRFEVGERTWPDPQGGAGRMLAVACPSRAELAALSRAIRRSGAQSIAVCLLHSYADPAIERRVARALAPLGLPITCSAELLCEFREVERFSTAAVNAALVPVMRDYLSRLGAALGPARLELLQSSGGTLTAEAAAAEPVRVLFSGPAGGVVGAARAAHQAGFDAMVGLDMGGTSTDVSFRAADGTSGERFESLRVAGHPIAVPALDVHTIGCGGGSLVRLEAGVLRVGPESAGADPGPACYGKGDEPTLTDAHLVLGHLAPEGLLGGALPLDAGAAERAFERLLGRGRRVRGRSRERVRALAEGALDVARAAMRRAVSVMTMQRGQDPARLLLVAFGGAGGLHAAVLARALDMRAALVPAHPGALSAMGMTQADALREASETVLAPLAALSSAERRRRERRLVRATTDDLIAAGHSPRSIEVSLELDLRYEGQSFELRVQGGDFPAPRLAEAFHRRHAALYGYRLDRDIEVVTLRARALVRTPLRRRERVPERRWHPPAAFGERRVTFDGRALRARLIDRGALTPGQTFHGPAVVQEYTGTTLVPPRARVSVTAGRHLLLTD
jgi:N-methylhydantoinase A